jgi:hypothetical protein
MRSFLFHSIRTIDKGEKATLLGGVSCEGMVILIEPLDRQHLVALFFVQERGQMRIYLVFAKTLQSRLWGAGSVPRQKELVRKSRNAARR